MSPTLAGRTRVAAYAICLDEHARILLCRVAPSIADGGMWTLPGGGLEFGEDPEVGVLRELAEETSLVGEIERLEAVLSRLLPKRAWADGADVHNVAVVYRVRASGDLRDEVGGTSDACAWFTREEAESLPLWDLAREGLRLAYGSCG